MRLAYTCAAVFLLATSAAARPPLQTEALRAAGAVALPGVEGRFDHFAIDLAGQRLFVAALGNNTMEVIDVAGMKRVKSIGGLHEPQGIRYLPDAQRIVVANGGDGATVFFDGATLNVAATAKLSGDADNVRYDAKSRLVYVGYADGALGALDTSGKVVADVRLPGHPESFQLETSGPRIFVNVPSAARISVVDRDKRAVVASWPVTQARSNYPMALDETNHRLFVGCRSPSRMLVYDTASGQVVTGIDIVSDTDDLFYDGVRRRLYVAGGGGAITVVEQQDADHYRVIQTVATAAGARTALFVPELSKLFLAVPHRGAQGAEIRAFDVR